MKLDQDNTHENLKHKHRKERNHGLSSVEPFYFEPCDY